LYKNRFDPEITIMNQLLKLMTQLDRHLQIRVLEWCKQRAVDEKYYEPVDGEEVDQVKSQEKVHANGQ
jgi:hypothetical protein